MTKDDKQRELARYRIRQAKECLEEASFLFEGGKSLRSVVNRAYYAMFYSVLALIVFESYSTSKHSGVLSYFHKRYIKEKVFPEDFGRIFQKAFEMRNTGDYQELSDPIVEKTEPLLKDAYMFVEDITTYLKNSQGV